MRNPFSQLVIHFRRLSLLLLLLPLAAVAQSPTIAAFSPASAGMGGTFTLTGTNLGGTTSVRLGEQSTRFVVNSATQLTVTVPRGASTHKVQVTTPGGVALSSVAFTVIKTNSTTFVPTGELIPFPDLNAYHAVPKVTDLDGDGLLDVLVFDGDDHLHRYEQTALNSRSFTDLPITLVGASSFYVAATITPTDLDGDGLLDLLVASAYPGSLEYYEQSAPNSTTFTLIDPAFNGLDGTASILSFADLDSDGRLDLLVGGYGTVSYYEQDAANSLAFSLVTDTFNGISVGRGAAPGVTDLEGDGRLDLFVGQQSQSLLYYRQNAVNSTAFTLVTTAFNGLTTPYYGAPTFTDLDGDGLLDLLLGWEGGIDTYEQLRDVPVLNSLSVSAGPVGTSVTLTGYELADATAVRFSGVTAAFTVVNNTTITATVPAGVTLSGDVTVTSASGTSNGVRFSLPPLFSALTPASAPMGGTFTITGANLDNTTSVLLGGQPAAFVANSVNQLTVTVPRGASTYRVRVTTPAGTVLSSTAFHVEKVPSTVFVPVTTALSGVSGSQLGASTFADLDGDGLLDLLVGERTSDRLKHYEQDALNSASFTLRTSDFSGIRVSAAAAPAITDFDGDGLLDLIVGERDQQVSLYEQDAPHSTSFSLRRANFIQTLQNGGALDYYLAPTVTDIDGDGLLDLLLGGEYGTVWRYEQGAANSTDFPLVNYGIDNMNFGGISVLIDSNPAVVDLEGDGLLDILAGPSDQEGITHYRQAAINSEGFTQVTQVFSGITAPNYEAKPTITDLDGDGRLDLLLGFNGSSLQRYEQVGPTPVLTSLSAPSGPIGASITLTGTNLDGATAVSFNGTPATSFSSSSATSVTVTVPAGATTGPVTLTTPGGTSNSLTFTILSDLTVSTVGQTIGGGTYHNITVTGTGEATLGGDLTVTGALVVQDGGALADGCHIIRGAGAFSLQAGAALSICAAAGISASGATGAVQVTGARSFAADATYRYVGTQAQVTGAALPSSVRELAVANTAGVTLSQATAVTNVLRLSSGVLSTSSNTLTLLSTTSRTAYAVHAGGTTSGNVTVQRYVGGPTAVSYHHLASPVQNSTVSDLATAGYTPVVNAAYNALPYVAPPARQFPNVFGYDEQRGGTATAYQGFGIGYYSPASLSSALTPGRGWSVALAGDKTPDFVGALTTGSLNVALSHTGTNSSTNKAGWHLLGNPYPQPIDWDLVATPANVEASVYVWYPTGGNNGAYRVRNASGVGNLTEGLIGVSQGFWVRTTAPATFPFTNALRVENDAVPLGRMAAGSRPHLTLTLAQVGAPAELTDEVTVYAEPDATRGFDGAYDATRPGRNVGVPTLSVLIDGQEAMISALPDASFTAGASVELLLDVPAAGTYTLTAATLTNLPNALLLDRVTNTTYDLASQPTLAFATAAGEVRDRFALLFGARVLGVAAEATTPAFALYPNPARGVVRVACAVAESATLLDATGRTVRVWTLAPGATADLSLAGLTPGVYTVRVGTTSRRLVIE